MARQPEATHRLAREKRDLARRARRLAETQADADRKRLTSFADELDKEAEALEQEAPEIGLPPGHEHGQVQHQQVQQQQQSAETPSRPPMAEKKD